MGVALLFEITRLATKYRRREEPDPPAHNRFLTETTREITGRHAKRQAREIPRPPPQSLLFGGSAGSPANCICSVTCLGSLTSEF